MSPLEERPLLIQLRQIGLRRWAKAGVALTLTGLAALACAPNEAGVLGAERARFLAANLSEQSLVQLRSRMDPAMRALAWRHDPATKAPDHWARTEGWESLDISQVPNLGLPAADPHTAEELNALRPFADDPIRPMRPACRR